jgi:small subunit ribosomal protein S15
MGRMHSRKKGQSESTRPAKLEVQPWFQLTAEQVEAKVIDLAKKGESMSKIGLILRDAYGVPLVKILCKKTISQILAENNLVPKLPEDIMFLARRAVKIRRHMEENKKDLEAKKGLQRTESKLRRLVKYYKNTGVIEQSFKYDPEEIKIFMR